MGSEVLNLLEAGAAATLVVSQHLDIGVPVGEHAALREKLDELRDFEPSADEPSVWTPRTAGLLELNFVGIDPRQDPAEAYVLDDDRLPLLVFGALSLVSRGAEVEIAGTRLVLPRPAGLLLEKLVTDRTGAKGERDLLVALGVLETSTSEDLDELERLYRALAAGPAPRGPLEPHDPLAPRPAVGNATPRAPPGRGGRASPPPHRGRFGGPVTAVQERRLREFRSRLAVRGFEYRQRRHARGVWFRFRRLLALSSDAYAVPREEAERLVAEGCRPDPVGWELAPSRLILVVPPARAEQIPSARPLAVRLNAELLAAESLVLVPFPE